MTTLFNKIISLIAFCFFISASNAQNTDLKLLHSINSNSSANGDKVFKFISKSTAPICFATPFVLFTTALARHDKELQRKSYVSFGSVILLEGVNYGIKRLVKRKRPYETYPDVIIKKSNEGTYSFPSGHTALAFGTATSLSLAFPKWYVIAPSFLVAGAVGYSRMYLGVHYPSDVLGGIVVGVGCSLLAYQADRWLRSHSVSR